MAVLPPNVSAEDFNSAINEFRNVVGDEWVFTNDEDTDLYRDPFSSVWGTDEEVLSAGAVGPDSVEQVQAIVGIANKYKIPLFSISTGKNFAYGGPSPNLHGSVVLDLKRMNRILEVNEDRNFALVEPGVTYFDLYRHIQENNLKLWIDCPDPGWGSFIGNSLERGVGYTQQAYKDHFAASCGMEVVLASGEIMRTGMGALPGSDTWQEYRHGFGPDPAGMFAQGNLGVVTKMGFRLMPQPESYYTGMISVPKRLDLIPLIKKLNYLSDLNLMGEPVFGTAMNALMQNPDFKAALNKPGGPTDAEFDRFASDNNLHAWQVELQFYGPERTNLANWDYAKEVIMSAIPGARAHEGRNYKVPMSKQELTNTDLSYTSYIRRETTQGVPSLKSWKLIGRNDGAPEGNMHGDAAVYPIVPRSGEAVFEFQRVFADALRELGLSGVADSRPGLAGISALTLPVAWYQYAYQMRIGFAVSRSVPEHNVQLHRAMVVLMEIAAEHGWGDYRTPPIYQDLVARSYSFNNNVLRRFNETVKDAVDPNGILSPGRGGVWPSTYNNFRRT